ncbi:hypothetical protein K2X30_01160 [bacterium]|jgi:hypothetical protein|nr:hypothetical protein [bacterium]
MKAIAASLVAILAFGTVAWAENPQKVNMDSLNLSGENSKWIARVFGGMSLLNYSLNSSGLSLSVPNGSGAVYGAELRRRLSESGTYIRATFLKTAVTLKVSGLSPSSVNQEVTKVRFLLSGYLFQSDSGSSVVDKLSLGLGAELLQQSTPPTSPSEVMSSLSSTRLLFLTEYINSLKSDFRFEFRISFGFPISHYEKNQNTGFYNFGYFIEPEVALTYSITEVLQVGVSANATWEQKFFSGAGSRGTQSASERILPISVPFEVRFNF